MIKVLEQAEKKILEKISIDSHLKRYAKALKESLTLNPDEGEIPSPQEISDSYGIPTKTLMDYFIVLDREDSCSFLNDVGFEITQSVLDKKVTLGEYEEKFSRPISKAGKPHVFTYAEILHLVDYIMEVELPESLQEVLRK